MCRSIKRLRDGAQPAGEADVQEAARQFVRKVSGFGRPAAHNQAAFDAAVAEVAAATTRLLGALDVRGAPRPAPIRQGQSSSLKAG